MDSKYSILSKSVNLHASTSVLSGIKRKFSYGSNSNEPNGKRFKNEQQIKNNVKNGTTSTATSSTTTIKLPNGTNGAPTTNIQLQRKQLPVHGVRTLYV